MSRMVDHFGPEQHELHPGPLTWPGAQGGLPILGEYRGLSQGASLPRCATAVFHRLSYFDTWNPEHMRTYSWVMSRIATGWFKQVHREPIWDEEHKGHRIFLEWFQLYAAAPGGPAGPAAPPTHGGVT